MTTTVNALSQLEDYVKDKKYPDITQSLSVSPLYTYAVHYSTMDGPMKGRERNINFIQAVHVCPTYRPALEANPRAPGRDTSSSRIGLRYLVSLTKVASPRRIPEYCRFKLSPNTQLTQSPDDNSGMRNS